MSALWHHQNQGTDQQGKKEEASEDID